jgi:hypothetical protein
MLRERLQKMRLLVTIFTVRILYNYNITKVYTFFFRGCLYF